MASASRNRSSSVSLCAVRFQLQSGFIAYLTNFVSRSGAIGGIRGTGKDMDKVVRELARKSGLTVSEVEDVMGRLYGDLKQLRRDRKAIQEAYVTVSSRRCFWKQKNRFVSRLTEFENLLIILTTSHLSVLWQRVNKIRN